METILTFDQLPNEVAKQGVILEQIQTLLNQLVNLPQEAKEEYFDIDQASSFLSIAKATLYVKVSRREVPSIRRGKRLYFSKLDLIEYLNGGKRKTKDEIQATASTYINKKGGK